MKTYKVLGLLLTYPDGRVYPNADALLQLVRSEALLPAKDVVRLEQFVRRQQRQDQYALQEQYVETFDRGRACCLHLFEHIHGESRMRGQAMVDMIDAYASKGLYISSGELPDYLPLFLEYLSNCELAEARGLLGEAIDVIAMIGVKLRQRKSPYSMVFGAIEQLSAVKPNADKIAAVLRDSPQDPATLEELDEQWREAEAFGSDAAAGCGMRGPAGAAQPTIKPIKWQ